MPIVNKINRPNGKKCSQSTIIAMLKFTGMKLYKEIPPAFIAPHIGFRPYSVCVANNSGGTVFYG